MKTLMTFAKTAPVLLLLGGCNQVGPTHAAVAGASVVAAGIWGASKVGADTLQEKLYGAMHHGDPSVCKSGMYNVYCHATRENMARLIATQGKAPLYDELAAAVERCDAGKIPVPPYQETECDKYRAFVHEIDARVAELKKSGAV